MGKNFENRPAVGRVIGKDMVIGLRFDQLTMVRFLNHAVGAYYYINQGVYVVIVVCLSVSNFAQNF